jgi:hypothetical protein
VKSHFVLQRQPERKAWAIGQNFRGRKLKRIDLEVLPSFPGKVVR